MDGKYTKVWRCEKGCWAGPLSPEIPSQQSLDGGVGGAFSNRYLAQDTGRVLRGRQDAAMSSFGIEHAALYMNCNFYVIYQGLRYME